MRMYFVLNSLLLALVPISAQAQTQISAPATAGPPQSKAGNDDEIVIRADRDKGGLSLVTRLRDMIDDSGASQLARFEASICPMVIGMPRDLTPIMTRIIRNNIVESGGEVGKPGCKVNAAAIFIDQPQELIIRLRKAEPEFFMNMTPREFGYFSAGRRAAYSWHTVNRYTKDGGFISGKAVRSDGSRLYTSVRDEMESGIVVIDRQATIGKSIRQLADFATMHLMVDVNWRARRMDQGSILALFNKRNSQPAQRMSAFDQNALRGFYLLRENNQFAASQRQNIARAIKRQEEGKPVVGTRPDK